VPWILLKNHFFALPKVVRQQFIGEVGRLNIYTFIDNEVNL